jgi:hypothetical protein
MDEKGYFKYWSICVDINVTQVYRVGADGHMSTCLGCLVSLAFCGGLTGHVLICCSLLRSFAYGAVSGSLFSYDVVASDVVKLYVVSLLSMNCSFHTHQLSEIQLYWSVHAQ